MEAMTFSDIYDDFCVNGTYKLLPFHIYVLCCFGNAWEMRINVICGKDFLGASLKRTFTVLWSFWHMD